MNVKILSSTNNKIKIVSGKIFKIKNIEFICPFKKYNTQFEFYHIKSGKGFNGNLNRNMDSIKEAIKRVGEEKFYSIINNQKTLNEQLKIIKRNKVKNINTFKEIKELSKIMGISLVHSFRLRLLNITSIDIFKMESELKRVYNYNEKEHGSLKNFIGNKFGKNVEKRIENII